MTTMRNYMTIETASGISRYVVDNVKTWRRALEVAQTAFDKGFYPVGKMFVEDTFIRLTTPNGWTRKRLAMADHKLFLA